MRIPTTRKLTHVLALMGVLGILTTATVVDRLAAQEAASEDAPRAPRRQPGSAAASDATGENSEAPASEGDEAAAAPPDATTEAPGETGTEAADEPEVVEFRLPPPPPDRVEATPIELVRYRVQMPVVFQPDPLMGPAFRQQVLRELERIADTNIGPMWNIEITEANWITPLSRAGLERLEPETLKRRVIEEQVIEVIREQFVTETVDRRLREELAVEVIRARLANETYSERINEPDRDLSITPEQIRFTTESQLSIRGDETLPDDLRRQIRSMLDTDNTKQPVEGDKDAPRPKTAQEQLLPDVIGAIAGSGASELVRVEVYKQVADTGIGALVSDARRVHLDGRPLHKVMRANVVSNAADRFAAPEGWQLSDGLRTRVRTMLDTEEDEAQEERIGELVAEIAPEKTPPNVLVAVREMLYFYLVPPVIEMDKMYPVSIERRGSEYTVSVREWDRESEFISTVQSRTTINRQSIANEVFRVIRPMFRPIVQIESADQATKTARIRYKAGEYPPGDPGFRQIEQGSMFVPFFRYLDRKRVVQRIQTLPWTYITAQRLERIRAHCDVDTGVGTPLGAFRARRMELRAIELRPHLPETSLTIVPQRSGTRKPLVGYLVAIYDEPPPPPPKPGAEPPAEEESAEPKPEPPKPDIYRSDRNGQVTIPVDPNKALQWVLIRSGSSLLTKFPFVAGAESSMVAQCPDDTIRLNVEGQISLLTGRLIDTIAKRHMVMAMVKNRAKKSQWKKVDESLQELDELEHYDQFKDRVGVIQFAAIERAQARGDRRAVSRIKKLGSTVLKIAEVHLDKEIVDDFRAQTEEMKRMGADSAAALGDGDNDPPSGGGRAPGGGRTPGQ